MKNTIWALLLFSFTSLMAQQARKNMSIVDYLSIPVVSNPQLAPDGKQIVYTLSESDWDGNKQISHLWKVNLDDGKTAQFTAGENGESGPLWSPDGKWISFLAKRGDDKVQQLYLISVYGGEAQPLTQHKTAVGQTQWSPDGKYIYFVASDTISAKKQKALDERDDVFKFDEDYEQKHLWRVNIETKKEEQVTSGNFSTIYYSLSEQGDMIVEQRSPNPLYGYYLESEVWVMDSTGANAHRITDNQVQESGAKISPNEEQVLFTAFANEDFEPYYNDKLFLAPTQGEGNIVTPFKDFPYEVISAEWSEDGNSIFFTANMGSRVQLWEYELALGKLKQLTKGDISIVRWRYQRKTDQHVLTVAHMYSPGDIFILKRNKLTQVTHHYDYLKEEFALPKQEVIQWTGQDGVPIEGILYYPYDYDASKKYPLVVQTHGGPASSDKIGFSLSFTRYNAVLTGQGYVVFQPNYRGSTGYGDDFLRDMVGSYFNQAHLDVMTGVDFLIEKGIADPDKMVKMGWSAGGHMTNKIITITDRFKAASSGAGALNWISMYAQSDVRAYRTPWFGGTPWQKDAPLDVYMEHSPLKDIANAKTPTLIFVGQNDVRVPLPQSVELYRALTSLDVPTNLYVAPREGHGWKELRHRLFKINAELEWFAKYALDKTYEWEKAP